MQVLITLADGAKMPTYGSDEAAGLDLYALKGGTVAPDKVVGLKKDESGNLVECKPNDPDAEDWRIKRSSLLVDTGVCIALPENLEGGIRSRSGLASKKNVRSFEGTVDSDYRGRVKVLVYNHGFEPFTFEAGERIGQMVISEYKKVELQETDTLPETVRGVGGFGHTGK